MSSYLLDTTLAAEFTQATSRQKAFFAVGLLLLSLVLLGFWFDRFDSVQGHYRAMQCVSWTQPSDYVLTVTPSTFWYDGAADKLCHLGPLGDAEVESLAELLVPLEDENAPPDPEAGVTVRQDREGETLTQARATYYQALSTLAAQARQSSDNAFYQLLLLGDLSGMLGVQLRSLVSFLHASGRNRLDLRRWWPWYVVRPLQGFILGTFGVLIVEAGLMSPGNERPTGVIWWVSFAILAGFGAGEFVSRLRLITQTLFGQESGAS